MTWFDHAATRRLRRRSTVRQGVLVAALLIALALSALLWPRQRADVLPVPTSGRAAAAAGVVAGRLSAERWADRVCFAVTAASGTMPLVLPSGWAANESQGLVDPSGVVVGRPGAVVRVVGEPGSIGTAPGCPQRGRVWRVSAIRERPAA